MMNNKQPGLNIAESVGKWLRETGEKCATQAKKIDELEAELLRMKEARRKSVETMQKVAGALGLQHPDPKKIVSAIERLLQR